MVNKILLLIIFIIYVSGCTASRGFDRGKLQENLSLNNMVTDKEIERVLSLKSQLRKPFTLGIYFKNPEKPKEYYWKHVDWAWSEQDKDSVLKVAEKLEERGIISECIFISSSFGTGSDVKTIRYLAARHGVDAVLVLNGALQIDRYNNMFGPLYMLIVTGAFIPGSVADSLFLSHAALWDVRNGFLYLSTETEGEGTITAPAFFIRENIVINQAKACALTDLSEKIEYHINSLAIN